MVPRVHEDVYSASSCGAGAAELKEEIRRPRNAKDVMIEY
jgi:hypothetical protein